MNYLDNAATSWPKPDGVGEAMARYLREVGASPGRSAHRLSNEAERIRLGAREAVAALVGVRDPLRVVFTHNGTAAINMVLFGLLAPGAHVITTGMEHNAMMRPLRALEARGVSVSVARCGADGTMDAAAVAECIRPETRLIAMTHASNVCGTVLPVREVGALAHERGIPLLVDAAQTAGCWPIDVHADNIDLLAFTGHKAMLGPTGAGGLVIREDFEVAGLPAFVHGGTGSRSEHEIQPDFLPDKYEAGTPNAVGLAGLAAGVGYVLERGVLEIRSQELNLTQALIDGLGRIRGVRIHGTRDACRQTGVVSFGIEGQSPAEIALALDEEFEIMCRPGLHCAPRAHLTMGTSPEGTVRLSLGVFTTALHVERAVSAVMAIAGAGRRG